MTTASVLAFIMVLAFAADRVAKSVMFCLAFVPAWHRRFPDPELIENKVVRQRMRNRYLLAYTVIVGAIAAAAVLTFPDLRILDKLTGETTDAVIDIVVTVLVLMGGSDLLGRIVQVSGIGDMGAAAASGETSPRNKPVEVVGRLVLENEGPAWLPSQRSEPGKDATSTVPV
jgi:hypothetical protein